MQRDRYRLIPRRNVTDATGNMSPITVVLSTQIELGLKSKLDQEIEDIKALCCNQFASCTDLGQQK
ncbi:hypothetical protein EYF80_030589 [Liparis tanakae]|uniref:Uncharacterized protein n=1 Tax=Liparis tanakae TaxID=230148 RepID=A0A4Z2H0D1_9TELE|nr:hypothetical protein EYF80_030589 [Liparis tanakae]